MIEIDRYCIDRFEAPNLEGSRPFVARRADEGERWCAERGKRLCTEDEWVRACEGRSGRPFPYGDRYRRGACNDDKEWRVPDWGLIARYPSPEGRAEVERLDQSDPSGSRAACLSEEGVADLAGNATEWVVRTRPHGANHRHVMKGCYWAGCYGGAPPGCTFTNGAHPGHFRSYEAGFRCCLSLL
jgi:formylglycine-generating enzyme required for sulfatase activity